MTRKTQAGEDTQKTLAVHHGTSGKMIGKANLFSAIQTLWAFTILLCSVESPGSEPNAVELVRAVRESENWLHRIDSLQFRVDGKWSRPPESIAARRAELKKYSPDEEPNSQRDWSLKPSYGERLEYAIDFRGKRLRYVEDTPGREYCLHVGDVKQAIQYTKWADGNQRYDLNSTTEMFEKLFGSLSWPRAQPHSFWWEPKDVEQSMHRFGREEDFRISGSADYRGVTCYVLEYAPPNEPGQIHQWYVGAEDHLLYGRLTKSKSGSAFEYWTLDYKEVAPGCRIPMTQGYNVPGYNPAKKQYYVAVRRDVRIAEVKINKTLPEDLFEIEFKEGLTVYDMRSGKFYTHIDIPPSLIGKPLPKTTRLGINLATDQTEDKMILVCFFDMEQRPSRNCLRQLCKRAQELKTKDIVVVAVQASTIEQNSLNEWIKKIDIPFPIGMIQGDEEKLRFTWGVKSLPWLILTDKNHIVCSSGFSVTELDNKRQSTPE